MWNLSGDDIQRAKEELKGRRAAIKARYDSEIQQLESAIADIETFERTALNFVTNLKGGEASPAAVAEPTPAPVEIAADGAGNQTSAEAERAAAIEPANTEPAAHEKGSSRWRMRLSATEVSS